MLEALFGILIIVLAVWVVRRLLDVERGRWVVTLLAVLIGEACTVIVLKVVTKNVTNLPLRAVFGVYALVTVFAMLAVMLVELIARPAGRRRHRGIPHPIQGVRRLAGRTVRYTQVSMIAIRHGLVHTGGSDPQVRGSRLGRSLGAALEDAGGCSSSWARPWPLSLTSSPERWRPNWPGCRTRPLLRTRWPPEP